MILSRLRKISRFERRLLIAMFFCATTPFIISALFIPQIIESRLALSMHNTVREQLLSSAIFYKQFFDAKKAEYAARTEAISRDPVLLRALEQGNLHDLGDRLEQTLEQYDSIRSIRIRSPARELLIERDGPKERHGADFAPKTITIPLGLGEAPWLEVEWILSKSYLADRQKSEEVATLYDASLRTERDRAKNFYLAFLTIALAVLSITLTVAYFLARNVTSRVATLAQATERVGQGEAEFEIPVRGNDEITELSAGFNRMIEEIAQARDRIVYLEKVSGWQDFARRLAHEIKNPLTPIRLAVQELRRRAPKDDPRFSKLVEDSVDVVEEEITALKRLVDEFSQFARLPEVSPLPADLSIFLKNFLNHYNYFDPEAKVELTLPGPSLVAGVDRVLLRRVLYNLVMNGIQAAGAGEAVIDIRCARTANNKAELRITDNGPGIPEDQARRIFDPYYTTKSDGTGLGLAIVKKIVLQHGGSIRLDRSVKAGASFVILLPLSPPGTLPTDTSERPALPLSDQNSGRRDR